MDEKDTVSIGDVIADAEPQDESVVAKAKEKVEAEEERNDSVMHGFLAESPTPPSAGDLVEGPVIGIESNAIYVDMPPFGTGIIYGREYINARDIIKKINMGDNVAGKVVDAQNDDGYIEISLKEARQALIWGEADEAIKAKTMFELPVKEANKGGLILDWQGIGGFLPASQLGPENYPRVADGDKDRILDELRKLVGESIKVYIITADPKEGKLIFSEKGSDDKRKEQIVDKYNLGDELEGEVTGMVDFGVFVKIEDSLEGLVHISELDWGLVEDPRSMFSIGDKVKVKIIEIKDGKISLSIKALKENPWVSASKKYKKGQKVDGVVIKFNKHGALVSIEEGVAGLVHISDFGTEEKLHESLELGKTYSFSITLFEPMEQKMTLTTGEMPKEEEKK